MYKTLWKWEGKGSVKELGGCLAGCRGGKKGFHKYKEKSKKRGWENVGVRFRARLKTMGGRKIRRCRL